MFPQGEVFTSLRICSLRVSFSPLFIYVPSGWTYHLSSYIVPLGELFTSVYICFLRVKFHLSSYIFLQVELFTSSHICFLRMNFSYQFIYVSSGWTFHLTSYICWVNFFTSVHICPHSEYFTSAEANNSTNGDMIPQTTWRRLAGWHQKWLALMCLWNQNDFKFY